MTIFVDGAPSKVAQRLLEVTERSLEAGIEKLQPGGRLYDVGHAVQEVAEAAGFSVVREYAGHGVGRALHEDPQVPNYGDPGRGPLLEEGMVSLSAHFEHTIAVTEDGPEVLTARSAA